MDLMSEDTSVEIVQNSFLDTVFRSSIAHRLALACCPTLARGFTQSRSPAPAMSETRTVIREPPGYNFRIQASPMVPTSQWISYRPIRDTTRRRSPGRRAMSPVAILVVTGSQMVRRPRRSPRPWLKIDSPRAGS